MNDEKIKTLREKNPTYRVHHDVVYGIPLLMFYSIYPGDDPTCIYPYIEDYFIVTEEGIPVSWVSLEEVKHMEDKIFAAYNARGKPYGIARRCAA